MEDLNDIVQSIGRKYTEQRKEIAERFRFEFNTEETQKAMNYMIEQCEKVYREEIREKKIEHLLNDTILRK
jgi:hypothetical protein